MSSECTQEVFDFQDQSFWQNVPQPKAEKFPLDKQAIFVFTVFDLYRRQSCSWVMLFYDSCINRFTSVTRKIRLFRVALLSETDSNWITLRKLNYVIKNLCPVFVFLNFVDINLPAWIRVRKHRNMLWPPDVMPHYRYYE